MSTLDDRLADMASALPQEVVAEARRVAHATRPTKRQRRRWALPLLVTGGVVATAGTSVAVATMTHWAGVGMPLENVRNEQPIPVGWVTEAGHEEQCRAWVELRHPQPGDRERLDAAIRAQDWQRLGQQLYDQNSALPDDADGEGRVAQALEPRLQAFVEQVFPGTGWLGGGADQEGRSVQAYGMNCAPGAP